MQGHRFGSWCGKITHAAGQLILRATTTEARVLQREAAAERSLNMQLESSSCLLQLEKALLQQQTQCSQK